MTLNNKNIIMRQAGFTLIEILVGLVIGLIATLVIMQVFSVFEGQKRTTTGTADAQINGSIALYNVSRELQMAGFGLFPVTESPIECAAITIDPTLAASGIGDLTPVSIIDGGVAAGATDSITIHYSIGGVASGGIPVEINAVSGVDATMDNNMGCQVNDIAMAITSATPLLCAMTNVTALTGTTGVTLGDVTNVTADSKLACLGTWNETTFRVNASNLERNAVPSVADIINIQAQYGISNATNLNQVVQWVDATGGTWAAPTSANRNRIKAIRIAIVARNGLLEKTDVSSACSSLTLANPTGLCAWDATSANPINASPAPAIDLTNDPDWRRYRYRVFETIIPLRNMIWAKDTL